MKRIMHAHCVCARCACGNKVPFFRPFRRFLIAFALGALAATAMPSKEEQAKVQSIVNELMKDHITANKKGKESNEAVGDAAIALAKDAQGEAAKFALFKSAVTYYARGKAYDKAADTIEAIMAEIRDVPPQTLNGIVQKAAANATEKKAPRLVALKKATARRAKAAASLNDVEMKLKKSPSDPSLKRMHAELLAATGDWEAALKEFAALGGAVGKIAEDEANGTAATAADFWWDYTPAALEAKDAIKEHASTLYRKALDYGELTGLKKNLAEKRIAEFTPVLASTDTAPKVEYKFNYKLDNKGNAILIGEPCVSPKPEGVLIVPNAIDGHNVIGVEGAVFTDCDKMTKIILPKDLEYLHGIQYDTRVCPFFRRCHSLGALEISKSNSHFTSVNGVLYTKNREELVVYPKTRNDIQLVGECKAIGSEAFQSCAFKIAKVPNGVERQYDWAFVDCLNLEVVEYPKSFKWVAAYGYFACPKIKKLVFTGDAPEVVQRRWGCRDNLFSWGPQGIEVEVRKGTKGWKSPNSTELPERWPMESDYSRPIRYIK